MAERNDKMKEITKESVLEEWKETANFFTQLIASLPTISLNDMGMNAEGIQEIYRQGYNAFQAENYDQAENLFLSLVMLDFKNIDYQLALGAAYETQEKYENALAMYMLAMMTGKDSPAILYRTAKCLLSMGNKTEALIYFKLASESEPHETGLDGQQRLFSEKSKKMVELLS